jgi:hypothetical protein
MRKKTDLPARIVEKKASAPADTKLFIVTDRITGFINFKRIEASRGDFVYLNHDEAKVFKDSILEL